MSDPTNTNTPANSAATAAAGWYRPTPESSELRWWDGHRWTDNVQSVAAALPSSVQMVPAGTPVYNVFIWLFTLLPLVSLAALSQFDMAGYVTETMQYSAIGGGTTPLLSSSYLLLIGSAWLVWGVTGRPRPPRLAAPRTGRLHPPLPLGMELPQQPRLPDRAHRSGAAAVAARYGRHLGYVAVVIVQFIAIVFMVSTTISTMATILPNLR